MSSSYFITFDGNRVTYPGVTGAVAWEDIPVRRYEYTLFSAETGTNSGTLASAISSFDEVIFGVGWRAQTSQYGVEYITKDAKASTFYIPSVMSNDTPSLFMFGTVLTSNDSEWKVSSATANQWWIQTPFTTTAKWTNALNTGKSAVITEIIGVKYQ